MRLFEEYGTPSTAGDITYIDYLFLGDYVDRCGARGGGAAWCVGAGEPEGKGAAATQWECARV